METEINLPEFEQQNAQSFDKIKLAIKELKNGLSELGIDEDKLTPYLMELSNFETLYLTRLSKWKSIIEIQKKAQKQRIEALPEKLMQKESNQKAQLKQMQENNKELNEKLKIQKEEIAVLKIAIESYKFYEKRFYDLKYRYDELKHNTGNFHRR